MSRSMARIAACGAGVAALLLLLARVCAAEAQEGRVVGHVIQQRGPVIGLRQAGPRVLVLGAPLFVGDRVLTGRESGVKIELLDGSALSVGAGSEVAVVEFVFDADGYGVRGLLSLPRGIVRTGLAGHPWGRGFEIRTQAAVVSAHATDWVTEARAQRTSVFVVAGRVAVAPAGGGASVVLERHRGTDIEAGRPPSPPARWSVLRAADALARTRVP